MFRRSLLKHLPTVLNFLSVLELPLLAFALAICTALPSRVAISGEQSVEIKRVLFVLGGLLGDAGTVGPFVTLALILLNTLVANRSRKVGLGVLIVFLAASLIAQNAATEFRFERGVLPGPIDVRESVGHSDFLTAEAPLILAGRFLWMNLLSAICAYVILKRVHTKITTSKRSLPSYGIAVVVAGILSLSLLNGWKKANAYVATLHNKDALASPSAVMVQGLVQSTTYDGSPAQVRRLLVDYTGTPEEIAEGARNMGFAPEVAQKLLGVQNGDGPPICTPHPLMRSLDAEPNEGPILSATRALSTQLFRRPPSSGSASTSPIIFHVSLESMRADDIHAVNEAAPAQLTPFMSELYAPNNPSVAAFGHAHQSGIRTSQALAAVMCGMGSLPFNISMSRDLGAVPVRCMPDVLVDAGFRARAFYGHEFVFDDMGTFLRAHHVELHERGAFPPNLPKGVWDGISDASVYLAAVKEAEAMAAAAAGDDKPVAQYNFIMTLSHHTPYRPPEDFSAEDHKMVEEICARRSPPITGENCNRLKTLRYADESLRRFVMAVERSKIASRAIIVVSGDHTTHQWFSWTPIEPAEGITQVPFFVMLPQAARSMPTSYYDFSKAWNHFREVANVEPISNSDLPMLLLALLDQSAPLQSLSKDSRWHTLGGQVTSTPNYHSVTGQGVVHGIDAHGTIFDVSESGAVRPMANNLQMETLRGPEDITNAGPHNRPEIAFWGAFLRGYVAKCTSGSGHR